MKKALLLGAFVVASGLQIASAQNSVDTSIFPKPKQGMSQHVFNLPAQQQENKYMIEVVAGKNMMTDCNNIMISADLDHETLTGWGYPYYEVEDISPAASTMMACPNTTKSEKLVEMNIGNDSLVRYNSKLPLVIYAPQDVKVGYRIWQTDGTVQGLSQ